MDLPSVDGRSLEPALPVAVSPGPLPRTQRMHVGPALTAPAVRSEEVTAAPPPEVAPVFAPRAPVVEQVRVPRPIPLMRPVTPTDAGDDGDVEPSRKRPVVLYVMLAPAAIRVVAFLGVLLWRFTVAPIRVK
jgi:hypothetical protein